MIIMITPENLEMCDAISCTICAYRELTTVGYGQESTTTKTFPIYDYNRCTKRKTFESEAQ